jgi:NTP pyrophosphatase (non-canonical NTP hydrolase)
MKNIETLTQKIDAFADERDWNMFHSPKNLAISVAVESSELLEEFQWLTEEESRNLPADRISAVKDEIADVFINLLRLSSLLNIDLIDTAFIKIDKNALKYPVEKAKGNALKYNQY